MYHLRQFAGATPDKLGVHFLESGKASTFAPLERQANRAANALLSLGLKQHDCIARCLVTQSVVTPVQKATARTAAWCAV